MQETAPQYISRILGYIEGQDAIKVQRTTAPRLKKLIQNLTPAQLKRRPEPGKWSIAEIVAHLADTEVVASWRLRSVIGSSGITIQPYDQEAWAAVFQYARRNPQLSVETFRILRENNLAMLREIPREAWDHYGMHLERGKETVSHLARMFAGHDVNHVLQVERIANQFKKSASAPRAKKKNNTKKRKRT
jgi:hypothetical protein